MFKAILNINLLGEVMYSELIWIRYVILINYNVYSLIYKKTCYNPTNIKFFVIFIEVKHFVAPLGKVLYA